nr:hypothetical protein [Tanacetum cinerariifolium]
RVVVAVGQVPAPPVVHVAVVVVVEAVDGVGAVVLDLVYQVLVGWAHSRVGEANNDARVALSKVPGACYPLGHWRAPHGSRRAAYWPVSGPPACGAPGAATAAAWGRAAAPPPRAGAEIH